MLKKIDCVLLKVSNLQTAADLYVKTFGLKKLWSDGKQIGLGLSDSDTEIVLHADASIPSDVDVNYLVENVRDAVALLAAKDFQILRAPFDITIGMCAVLKDPIGHVWSILDLTKGLRK